MGWFRVEIANSSRTTWRYITVMMITLIVHFQVQIILLRLLEAETFQHPLGSQDARIGLPRLLTLCCT